MPANVGAKAATAPPLLGVRQLCQIGLAQAHLTNARWFDRDSLFRVKLVSAMHERNDGIQERCLGKMKSHVGLQSGFIFEVRHCGRFLVRKSWHFLSGTSGTVAFDKTVSFKATSVIDRGGQLHDLARQIQSKSAIGNGTQSLRVSLMRMKTGITND